MKTKCEVCGQEKNTQPHREEGVVLSVCESCRHHIVASRHLREHKDENPTSLLDKLRGKK